MEVYRREAGEILKNFLRQQIRHHDCVTELLSARESALSQPSADVQLIERLDAEARYLVAMEMGRREISEMRRLIA